MTVISPREKQKDRREEGRYEPFNRGTPIGNFRGKTTFIREQILLYDRKAIFG